VPSFQYCSRIRVSAFERRAFLISPTYRGDATTSSVALASEISSAPGKDMLRRREEQMFDSRPRLLVLAFLLALAAPGFAEEKCSVKAVLRETGNHEVLRRSALRQREQRDAVFLRQPLHV